MLSFQAADGYEVLSAGESHLVMIVPPVQWDNLAIERGWLRPANLSDAGGRDDPDTANFIFGVATNLQPHIVHRFLSSIYIVPPLSISHRQMPEPRVCHAKISGGGGCRQ